MFRNMRRGRQALPEAESLAILPQHHVAAGEEKPHVPVAYLRAALYERDAAGPHIGLQLVALHAQGKVRLRTFGQGVVLPQLFQVHHPGQYIIPEPGCQRRVANPPPRV